MEKRRENAVGDLGMDEGEGIYRGTVQSRQLDL